MVKESYRSIPRYAHTAGQATAEFILMLSLLTGIGILLMWWMTDQGPGAYNAIGQGQTSAVNAITNN